MPTPTMKDVADYAGVSTFTVSRALRGLDQVSEQTRAKVLDAAKKLNYSLSKSASSLASGKTNRISLLVRERISGWFIGQLEEGLYDVLQDSNYDLIIYRAANQKEREGFFTHLPAKRNSDALIISGFNPTGSERDSLLDFHIPIVSVNSAETIYCDANISIDDYQAEFSAVQYLAALGHKRFCFIDRNETLFGTGWAKNPRREGYLAAVTELDAIDCGVFAMDVNSHDSIAATAAQILFLPTKPTAICTWSDSYALCLISELSKFGVSIPTDFSIMGFDGSDIANYAQISTVTQPARLLGQKSGEVALTLINQDPLEKSTIHIPTQITPKATTKRLGGGCS